MNRALGLFAGLVILVLSAGALRTGLAGWSAGHSDIGFWWTVIGAFLMIAALTALIGTILHSRPRTE